MFGWLVGCFVCWLLMREGVWVMCIMWCVICVRFSGVLEYDLYVCVCVCVYVTPHVVSAL